jgi:16S rRNA (adenine1518-N6/adenine1519-N6)-dimethyltransferase
MQNRMAKKKWGQNFLISQKVVESIVQAADVKNGDSILEIGPGLGILTRALLDRNSQVTAIEIDPELCVKLRKRFSKEERFTLLEKDVMELAPEDLANLIPAPAKVVANLPYNIATPLILRMLPVRKAWQSLTLMIQYEVAERICATPESGKAYGPLSLVGELGFEKKIIKKIHPESFKPVPKVDSAVIRLLPRESGLPPEDEKRFLKWSHLLFQQRRKTLMNGIRQHFPEWYQNCGDSLRDEFGLRRPETLDFTEWMTLFSDYLQNEQNEIC